MQYVISDTQYSPTVCCPPPSTSVENALQISSFMQNKPNFLRSQMNVCIFTQMDYENKHNWTIGQNKPNSNPIKPNFQKAKMNVNSIITKDYRKNDDFVVRINKPNSRNAKNERKLICYRGLWKWNHLPAQKKQTQSNPILVDSCWSLSRTEFTPHFDAGMRGRNDNAGG